MLAYFVRWLLLLMLLMLLTLFAMSVLIRVLLRLMPGNVADILFDAGGFVNTKERARIEAELGLDLPLVQQYLNWVGALLRGNLGYSYVSERPAAEEILPRISVTAQLAAWALVFSVLLGVIIRTARAKGVPEAAVNYRHALRNALLPVVTIIGIEAALLVGGLIVTETVFSILGVARFLVEAILWRDYPVVQNLVMFIAVVVINFMVDLLYAALDPRIKYAD